MLKCLYRIVDWDAAVGLCNQIDTYLLQAWNVLLCLYLLHISRSSLFCTILTWNWITIHFQNVANISANASGRICWRVSNCCHHANGIIENTDAGRRSPRGPSQKRYIEYNLQFNDDTMRLLLLHSFPERRDVFRLQVFALFFSV